MVSNGNIGPAGSPGLDRSERQDLVGTDPPKDGAAAFDHVLEQQRPPLPAFQPVLLPHVMSDPSSMEPAERMAGRALLEAADTVRQQIASGAPPEQIAGSAAGILHDVQGRRLSASDAAVLQDRLGATLDALQTSPRFVQVPPIPEEQSVAEGQLARAIQLLELGRARPIT